MKNMHVLVVDDQKIPRTVVTHCLETRGHTVESVASGEEALRKFNGGGFDLVVTDREMPEMKGDQLALEIERINPRIPVVMCTGTPPEKELKGVSAILEKPFDLTLFEEALRKAMPSEV
jgi:CheY-like chemotaxis protein